MTHVAMTFVKRRKESWATGKTQPLDWQPASLPTELPGLENAKEFTFDKDVVDASLWSDINLLKTCNIYI